MEALQQLKAQTERLGMTFTTKPLIIGGLALQYYGIRQKGQDVDFVITDRDYQSLVQKYPNNRKDIWGDLGVCLEDLEIWRSIALQGYEWLAYDAVEEDDFCIASMERLYYLKASCPEDEKCVKDTQLIEEYLWQFHVPAFKEYAHSRHAIYEAAPGGVVYNG